MKASAASEVLLANGAGTSADMDSDTILAMAGLVALTAAVLTGALLDTPVVRAPFRWLLN
ncbi:MAG TPA: hypothetical protein VE666_13685 [Mycobacterium sp.]|nr:hypothetical protein [Mycobacterium sp.]